MEGVADKVKAITEGFKNFVFESPEMEAKAKKRAEICGGCEHAKGTLLKAMLPEWKNKEITGMTCSLCNCFLPAKVRQDLQRCPIQKW